MIALKSVPRETTRSAPPFPTDIGRLERRAYREELLCLWNSRCISKQEMIEGIVRLKQASHHGWRIHTP